MERPEHTDTAVDPDDCADMTALRSQIDRVDRALVDLLVERATYIDRATVIKTRDDLPARIGVRVEDVVTKVRASADARGLDPDLAETLWRQLIEWSIAREAATLGDDD